MKTFTRLMLPLALVGCARAATTTAPPRTSAVSSTTTALPAGRTVIDRYVQAIGGRDAVLRHSTIRYVGSFEMPAAGMKGDLSLVQAAPNKMAMTMTIPSMGQVSTGFDGTTGWAVNPVQGPRVLEGKELDQMREDAGPAAMLRSSDRIRSAETVELTSMGGQACYKVRIVYHSGRESFDCYSTETGLLVGMTQKQESPMGTVEVMSFLTDYKDFGGMKTATRIRQQMMGQEQILTIDRVEFDRPEDAKAVEVPEPVKPLVKKP